MADLTQEASEGWASYHNLGPACPYLNTSPASMAWHLGWQLARDGHYKPNPSAGIKDERRVAVTSGRGDMLNLRGRCDILLARFAWQPDNTFRPAR